MNKIGEWYWPAGDLGTGGRYKHESMSQQWVDDQCAAAAKYASIVSGFRDGLEHTAIQAGGHIGLFPWMLSRYFKSVLTFEPDPENFECLIKNLNERSVSNVKCCNAALGCSTDWAPMIHNRHNSGASHIDWKASTATRVDMTTIDHLTLQSCDLLQLDIEGYELAALRGAEQTIYKFRPVIVLEFNICMERYDIIPMKVVDWLQHRGYFERANLRTDNDHVFIHKDTL